MFNDTLIHSLLAYFNGELLKSLLFLLFQIKNLMVLVYCTLSNLAEFYP